MKPCLDCGTPSRGSRCPTHQRHRDQQRGTTTARGYGTEHQALRAQALAAYHPADPCRRCTLPLGPDPDALDLGHPTDGFTGYALEHADCNRGRGRGEGSRRVSARRP